MAKSNALIVRIIVIGFVFFFISSCLVPKTKELYLERFEGFVNRVGENYKNYNKKDWEWADAQFEKYNTDWYLKFTGKYSFQDQIKIKALIIEYNAYQNNQDLKQIIKELFKEDANKIMKKMEDYMDSEAEEDLGELIEGAAAIGDSAVKVLEDIIEKIDHSF